jgi:glycogen debranching enzyme
MQYENLRQTIYSTILDFATAEGINASGKEEIYGCIFGRDSAITILKILKATRSNSLTQEEKTSLLAMCRRALLTLCELQGTKSTPESGEEPGKFIHEFRRDKYDHLLALSTPWYVYPDGILRNYDSLDSTPLALIAIYKYYEQTKDIQFLLQVLPAVEKGLNWMITYGDSDKDGLMEYELKKERTFGGLPVQSWTDSHESVQQIDGQMPLYPIAPVEVQGYAWLSLKLWSDFYRDGDLTYSHTQSFAHHLESFADTMKKRFNEAFIFQDGDHVFLSQALDGNKNQIKTITGNPLLVFWASYIKDGKTESILEDKYVADIINRSFQEDMFDPEAGIRTMSTLAQTFNPKEDSYHNGSFWPKLNGMAHEGLVNMGYGDHAKRLYDATLKPIVYFGSPIELYIKTAPGEYAEFKSPTGQVSCRKQAWSAAVILDLLTL